MEAFLNFYYYYLFDSSVFAKHSVIYFIAYIIQHVMCPVPCLVLFVFVNSQVKSSHLYLYSAFNNTNCDKATAQYQNGKIVSIM